MRTNQVTIQLAQADILTSNQRLHWAKRAKATKRLRETGRDAAVFLTPVQRAHITVTVGWPDRRRRDVTNIQPTIKGLVDGMVDAGLLPDDSDAHLVGPDLRAHVAGVKGHVLLTFHIEPLEANE